MMRALFLTVIYAASLAQTAGPSLEYEVKAAFLLNFITFTEWPPTAFESASSPLRICVMAPDPFGGILARTIQGERVAGHSLTIDHPARATLQGCHVVFVPGATATGDELDQISTTAPILIVGESDRLWHGGATIRLAVDGGKVRFDVNQEAAKPRGLRFSPRLLTVARRVT